MTPAEALTKLLPGWRAGLPPELDAHVDDYVERNREVLLGAIALLLHGEHWAAVPLLLGRPVLAIGKDDGDARPQVLAVVDDHGRVHLRKVVLDDPPRWKALQHSLDVDLRNAKERVAALTAKIRAKTSLRRYAMTLWARARAEAEEAA